jgi:hypothetical protein
MHPLGDIDGPAAAGTVAATMIVETFYRGYRIEVVAELVDGAWDATVRIRRVLTDDKPHVERPTCRKVKAELAETRGAIWARRWVDLNGLAPV